MSSNAISPEAAAAAAAAGIPLDLVSIPDAARIAGLHVDTIRRRIQSGRIQSWGAERTLRVSLSDVIRRATSRRAPHQSRWHTKAKAA